MPTVCLNTPNTQVHLAQERLEVRAKSLGSACSDEVLREIPLRDVERVMVFEWVTVTSAAMAAMLRRGIPVSFFAWSGEFLGGVLPTAPAHGLSRLRQYQRTMDKEFALMVAGRIVAAKLYNQRRVLQRLLACRREEDGEADEGLKCPLMPYHRQVVEEAVKWLGGRFEAVVGSKTLDELRGHEGVCTARYFEAWSMLLPTAFPFERRSTRPPQNPVNACISFGATMLYNELVAMLHAHGLDPALGLLHNSENGRWSLALDLMEPFRPALVEALTLDVFSRQILKQEHFEPRNGGVYLNKEGRGKFILQYERRMERQFMSESVGHRTTLRQQLEQQCLMYKAALEEPEKFEPFLMN